MLRQRKSAGNAMGSDPRRIRLAQLLGLDSHGEGLTRMMRRAACSWCGVNPPIPRRVGFARRDRIEFWGVRPRCKHAEAGEVCRPYAVTSHSSPGQTADRVLVHVDTEQAGEKLVNRRLAYVSVSRGRSIHQR